MTSAEELPSVEGDELLVDPEFGSINELYLESCVDPDSRIGYHDLAEYSQSLSKRYDVRSLGPDSLWHLWEKLRQLATTEETLGASVERGEPTRLEDLLVAEKIRLSGIEFDNSLDHVEIVTQSLCDSIATGRIRSIVEKESHIRHLAKFCTFVCHETVKIGKNPAPSSPLLEKIIEDIKTEKLFVNEAFKEVANGEFATRYWPGPHIAALEAINRAYDARLAEIDPDLPKDVLHSEQYQDCATRRITFSLNQATDKEIAKMRVQRLDELASLGNEQYRQDDARQQLPDNLLEGKDVFVGQDNSQACAAAAFRMVFAEVAGQFLAEDTLLEPINRHYRTAHIHDSDYLKLFQTEAFKSRFDRYQVDCRVFAGMDLGTIARVARSVKEHDSDNKVLAVVGLQTDTAEDKSIQHRVLLLGADKDTVTVHDSNRKTGAAFREIPKDVFYRRWAVAHNSGYLVIAQPTQKSSQP